MNEGRTVSLDSALGSGLAEVIANGLENDESVARAQQIITNLSLPLQQQSQLSTGAPSSLNVEMDLVRTISQENVLVEGIVPPVNVSILGCSCSYSCSLPPSHHSSLFLSHHSRINCSTCSVFLGKK